MLVKYLANVDFPMSFPPQIRITGALAVKNKTKTDNYLMLFPIITPYSVTYINEKVRHK